jgi:hypothetical protein
MDHADSSRLRSSRVSGVQLLELRVLGLGLLQDGDVGVGFFPEGEEVLIGGFGFGVSPCMA